MSAIAFDLVVADTAANHRKGVSQAYANIGSAPSGFGIQRVQGSLYVTDQDNLSAIMALKALPWLPASVRDMRAFKVEHWWTSRRSSRPSPQE
jgi:virulence-associated protein VapD